MKFSHLPILIVYIFASRPINAFQNVYLCEIYVEKQQI